MLQERGRELITVLVASVDHLLLVHRDRVELALEKLLGDHFGWGELFNATPLQNGSSTALSFGQTMARFLCQSSRRPGGSVLAEPRVEPKLRVLPVGCPVSRLRRRPLHHAHHM